MDLTYIVHSERCALLLDGDGVCRWVVPKVDATDIMVVAAKRCVGGRFVATLDRETPGFMGHEPRVGTNLLFALVTDGRVALARFGPVTSFERLDAPGEAAFTARESAVCMLSSPDLDGAGEDAAAGVEVEAGQPSATSNEDAPDLDDVIATLARDVVADLDGSVEETGAAEEPEPETESTRFRPSGIVMRRELGFDEKARASETSVTVESSLATEDETRRFSRAAGDVPYEELFQSSRFDTPRRGMLPRR